MLKDIISKDKLFVILLIIGGVGILGGTGWIFRDKITALVKPKKTLLLETETNKPEFNFTWGLWEDPAGFSFEYPKELKVNVHPEDENNYSFLEMTADQKKGKLVIVVNDSEFKTLEEWLKKDELASKGSGLETKVASLSAQKVALGGGKEIVGFIDPDDVLYKIYVEPEGDDDFWREINSRVINSFKLIPLKGETETQFKEWQGDFDTSGVDVVEEVEVIQ